MARIHGTLSVYGRLRNPHVHHHINNNYHSTTYTLQTNDAYHSLNDTHRAPGFFFLLRLTHLYFFWVWKGETAKPIFDFDACPYAHNTHKCIYGPHLMKPPHDARRIFPLHFSCHIAYLISPYIHTHRLGTSAIELLLFSSLFFMCVFKPPHTILLTCFFSLGLLLWRDRDANASVLVVNDLY
jgi:hypothetical protein